MLRSRERASFSEAGILDRKKSLPECFRAAFYAFSSRGYCDSKRGEGKSL